MTERPSSDDGDVPRPEVSAFLHDRATSLDREAAPVTADEAARRNIVDATAPRRRWSTALSTAKVRTSPRSALAAAAVIALIVGALGGFALGRGVPRSTRRWRPRPRTLRSLRSARRRRPPCRPRRSATCRPAASSFAGGGPMTRVFDRTTSEGIDIHAFLQDQSANQEAFAVAPQVGCVVANSGERRRDDRASNERTVVSGEHMDAAARVLLDQLRRRGRERRRSRAVVVTGLPVARRGDRDLRAEAR